METQLCATGKRQRPRIHFDNGRKMQQQRERVYKKKQVNEDKAEAEDKKSDGDRKWGSTILF